MKAVVIGSMNMDFTMDVDHLPSKGETVPAVRLRTSPGGKGLNQAVALARLGAEVLMVGAVGNDASGKVLLGNLPKDRIPDFAIKTVDDSTGNAFITVDSQGNNTIVMKALPVESSTVFMAKSGIRTLGRLPRSTLPEASLPTAPTISTSAPSLAKATA